MTAYADQALVAHLARQGNTSLHARALELPDLIGDWLTYTVTTFPHFTSHTARHSEEIVAQLSQLLFHDGDPDRPAVDLSPMEAYLLVAGAFLHDAGMVVSDEEKADLIGSPQWAEWIDDGPGRAQWEDAEALRQAKDEDGNPKDAGRLAKDTFRADRLVRFMLADHYRRDHHTRAGDLVLRRTKLVGRFTFDDQTLIRPLADICRGHGLAPSDLEDPVRYPHKVQIRGDLVNVRFLAHLLRIGDLLDLASERACPLLLSAVAPLPLDSLSHWTHHQRITQRLTSVKEIRLRAECEEQAEHRNLRDWTQWLVDEVALAESTMARSSRHQGWRAPTCSLTGADPTITIEPAPHATYIPRDWTFQLDLDNVLQRLITDAYRTEHAWLRELIQNALDTTRCRLLASEWTSGTAVDSPLDVDEAVREAHPLTITVEHVQWTNPFTEADEPRVQVSVDDLGMGMSQRIVEDFFLQIGRSYYTTREFRDSFGFVPISRFGIGFLSVFGVSDHVVVETWTGRTEDQPLRITLTGPRSYLLTEKGTRTTTGTTVVVRLSADVDPGDLIGAVRNWCRMTEVPVIVRDGASEIVLRAPAFEATELAKPLDRANGTEIVDRIVPVRRADLHGAVHLRILRTPEGEDWTWFDHSSFSYFQSHPLLPQPRLSNDVTCTGGLLVAESFKMATFSATLNLRIGGDAGLDRSATDGPPNALIHVRPEIEDLVAAHLDAVPPTTEGRGWLYRQALSSILEVLGDFWDRQQAMIPVFAGGAQELVSLAELFDDPRPIGVEIERTFRLRDEVAEAEGVAERLATDIPFISAYDLIRLSYRHLERIITAFQYTANVLPSSDDTHLRFLLVPNPEEDAAPSILDDPSDQESKSLRADLTETGLLSLRLGYYPELVLVDDAHPIVSWWREANGAAAHDSPAGRVITDIAGLVTFAAVSGEDDLNVAQWVQSIDRPDETGLAAMPPMTWPTTALGELIYSSGLGHLLVVPPD